MQTRIITSKSDIAMLTKLLEKKIEKTPVTISITDGRHRSNEQNRLNRLWMNELAEQRGDETAEWYRGYCKLTIGVPILRAENEAFCKEYDEVIRPLPYEAKLKLMMAPFDFSVTRLMTTAQQKKYLDEVYRHFSEQGVVLTMPEDKRFGGREYGK